MPMLPLRWIARVGGALVLGASLARADVDWSRPAPHPRLFADARRWEALPQQITDDPVSRQIVAVVKNSAERLLDEAPVAYVDTGAFWHGPMRQAQGRILSLAMTYRLTGDARFLDRAKLEMRTMAELPHWYPQHFLDTAEGALGMAVGLDWLHAALTPAEREQFAAALVEKALTPSLRVADEKSWVSGTNNWTAVCHGGLVVAALAVAEREPALAKQIVDRALAHMSRYAELYAPVGAYSEGPDYWAYGTTFYALLAESLRTALGTTAGLERAPGFLHTADYTLQMTAPSGLLYNFGDNGSGLGYEPVMFWFARELRRGDLTEREIINLKTLADAIAAGAPRSDASRMLALALIWRDPSLKPTPAAAPLAWWSEGGSQPQAVLRSGWNDPRATFVGIKAGRADDSHAHMDIGSFVLEADGVRWAVDLGRGVTRTPAPTAWRPICSRPTRPANAGVFSAAALRATICCASTAHRRKSRPKRKSAPCRRPPPVRPASASICRPSFAIRSPARSAASAFSPIAPSPSTTNGRLAPPRPK